MPYRILAKIGSQTFRQTLEAGDNFLGSDPACHLCLSHPTVSPRHAVLRVSEQGVELEDLESQNGTLIGVRRVHQARLEPGETFVLGRAVLQLEAVCPEDLELGVELPHSSLPELPPGTAVPTGRGVVSTLDRFSLRYLPRLLSHLASGTDASLLAQHLGFSLADTLPVAGLEVLRHAGEEKGLLYSFRNPEDEDGAKDWEHGWIESRAGDFSLRVFFPDREMAEQLRPLIDSGALLLSLARGSRPPERDQPPLAELHLRPKPASVVAEVRKIYDAAERVAQSDVGVLICGESGTGKEVLARYIHTVSPRCVQPLVAVNCASLPRDLLEAELFGVERGVATGVDERPGKFEVAHGGSLFLDEIGDMAPETQAKILRVLQEKEVYRIGGHHPRPADARVIAATNRPISQMMAEGTFRADLYHRIATWVVELLPLRQRRADIPNLAAYFLAEEAGRHGLQVKGISRAAVEMLQAYSWPGNLRQLRNEISRAVLFLENGEMLDTSRLGPEFHDLDGSARGDALAAALERFERERILEALRLSGGNASAAARRLEISRATLYRRLKSLGIEPPTAGSAEPL